MCLCNLRMQWDVIGWVPHINYPFAQNISPNILICLSLLKDLNYPTRRRGRESRNQTLSHSSLFRKHLSLFWNKMTVKWKFILKLKLLILIESLSFRWIFQKATFNWMCLHSTLLPFPSCFINMHENVEHIYRIKCSVSGKGIMGIISLEWD